MKNSKDHDDFEDWAVAPQFEPMATKLRRLAPLTVTWRGGVHRFEPEARLMFGQRTAVLSMISLWGPTAAGGPFPRHNWIADVYVKNFGFVQGTGATPQAALDALDAVLPVAPLVLGGSC